jgi:crossover junction endodeoxyribonuclease RuvC
MLRKTVDLPDEKLSKDATDALAVAWCHLMKQNSFNRQAPESQEKTHQNNSKSSWADFVADNPDRVK